MKASSTVDVAREPRRAPSPWGAVQRPPATHWPRRLSTKAVLRALRSRLPLCSRRSLPPMALQIFGGDVGDVVQEVLIRRTGGIGTRKRVGVPNDARLRHDGASNSVAQFKVHRD